MISESSMEPKSSYTYPTPAMRGFMQQVSIEQFRASLAVRIDRNVDTLEQVYTYWNRPRNNSLTLEEEEALCIRKKPDGSFYLEIGNLLHQGDLPELEEILFYWARDEGWFDSMQQRCH
jgi:hypothetical protein